MDKKELINKVCAALLSHIAYLEWPGEYDSNESYRDGITYAKKVREYIEELKKL